MALAHICISTIPLIIWQIRYLRGLKLSITILGSIMCIQKKKQMGTYDGKRGRWMNMWTYRQADKQTSMFYNTGFSSLSWKTLNMIMVFYKHKKETQLIFLNLSIL